MEFKLNVTMGQTITVIALVCIAFASGFLLPKDNSNELMNAYKLGAFDVANNAIDKGYTSICDSNNNCVVLYEENFITEQLNSRKDVNNI